MHADTPKSHDPAHHGAFFGRARASAASRAGGAVRDVAAAALRSISQSPAPARLAHSVSGCRSTRSGWKSVSAAAEHLIAQAAANPRTAASSASSRSSTAWPRRSPAIDARGLANIRLHHGDATRSARLAAGRVARARRSALSRSVAETPALEAALRAGREHRGDRARAAAGGEFRFASDIPDYAAWTLSAAAALAGFRLDRGARRRLAQAVAGISAHALRGQGEARRPRAVLSDLSDGLTEPEATLRPRRCKLPGVTCQNRTTRCAVDGDSWSKLAKAASSACADASAAARARHDDVARGRPANSPPTCTGSGSGPAVRRSSAGPRRRSAPPQSAPAPRRSPRSTCSLGEIRRVGFVELAVFGCNASIALLRGGVVARRLWRRTSSDTFASTRLDFRLRFRPGRARAAAAAPRRWRATASSRNRCGGMSGRSADRLGQHAVALGAVAPAREAALPKARAD